MEKVIVDGKEVDVAVEIKDAKLTFKAAYAGKGGEAELKLGVTLEYFGEQLKGKIGGKVDDAIIDVVIMALKAL